MPARPRPKLIYLVTEDWYFRSHRLPMAKAAQAAGFDVAVATRVTNDGDAIRAAGFGLHPLAWRRRSMGPLSNFVAIVEILRLYRRERPALVHHVALKPSVLGGIAAILARVPAIVSSINGAGFVFATEDVRARLIRWPIVLFLRHLFGQRNSWLMVQNREDRDMLHDLRIGADERTLLVRGSGVDTDHFTPAPEPAGPVTVAFVGRMIETKGVRTLVAAQQELQRRGLDIRLVLAGAPDPENPMSIPEADLRAWAALPGIEWRGYCADIRALWQQAHIACQVSIGEGLPKSLLEAAAMGRPIVASDVPGCREVAHHGVNGLLVPAGNVEALADALARLADDPALRRRFGAASREIVEPALSAATISAQTADLYRRLCAGL